MFRADLAIAHEYRLNVGMSFEKRKTRKRMCGNEKQAILRVSRLVPR
jgi:hypothetical protein